MRYSYTPEFNRKTGLALSFAFFIPSMICLIIRTDVPFYRSILLACSILTFGVGAVIFFRFVMTEFTYCIESTYRGEDLVIICRTGKKTRTFLRVSLDTLVAVCEASDKKSNAARRTREMKKYFYCSDIFGKGRYYLYLYDDSCLCRVKFCPDKTILRVISDACKSNRNKDLT